LHVYSALKKEIEERVGDINGEFGEPSNNVFTIKIGSQNTTATYYIEEQSYVIPFIKKIGRLL